MPAPSVPPAPPLLSISTCLPRALVMCALSGRAKASVPPPAGNGTISVTGLLGQSAAPCASAQGAASVASAVAASRRRPWRGGQPAGGEGVIRFIPCLLLWCGGETVCVKKKGQPLQQPLQGPGGDHLAMHETLVVVFDVVQVVEVIDHQRVRLLQALARQVAGPVQPLQACAVAEVELGHRVATRRDRLPG